MRKRLRKLWMWVLWLWAEWRWKRSLMELEVAQGWRNREMAWVRERERGKRKGDEGEGMG